MGALLALMLGPSPTVVQAAVGCPVAKTHISPCPDLTLSDPSYKFVDNGATLDLMVTVHNAGTATSQATQVASSAVGWPDGSADVGPLTPENVDSPGGQPVTISVSVPAAQRGATTDFTLKVNPQQSVPESNTANDTAPIEVMVPAAPPPNAQGPDLSLAQPGYSFRDDNKIVDLSVVVLNIGSAPAPATQLAASATGWPSRSIAVAALRPKQQLPLTLSLAVPSAQRGASTLFTLTIDPQHTVDERDKANNSMPLTVAVPALPPVNRSPDFALSGATHRFAKNGSLLILTARVRNLGDQRSQPTTVASSAVGWPDESANVVPLDPGRETAVRLRVPVPATQRGTRTTFTLRVDPKRAAADRNPNNDTITDIVAVAGKPGHASGGFPWVEVAIGAAASAAIAGAGVAVAGRYRRRVRRPLAWRHEIPDNEERAYYPPEEFPHAPSPQGPPDEAGGWVGEPAPAPAPSASDGEPAAAPVRVVNTGFATYDKPDIAFDEKTPLVCGESYHFWLEVGPPLPQSIERTPTGLPHFAGEALLKVVVFGAGLTPIAGEEAGELLVSANGDVRVARPAAKTKAARRGLRLFFPVRAPMKPGHAQLRCNIYYSQVLVQSRLVTAKVLRQHEAGAGELRSELDYTLAPSLDASHLSRVPEHRLSILLNKTANGTHLLTFVGQGEFQHSAEIDELALQAMIEQTRGAMRRAAWGQEAPWAEGESYRYNGFSLKRLHDDLVLFARRGFRLYAAIADQLTGGPDKTDELNELMRTPGLVQVALRGSARRLLPAAMFYDYFGFETNRPNLNDYALCPQFVGALKGDKALEELDCFKGQCPARGQATVVCPSGFWGYRHSLGLPVSVGDAPDVPVEIGYTDSPRLTLAVSTDPELVERSQHETAIRALIEASSIEYVDSYEALLPALKAGQADVIYFYCHGGLDHDAWPYVQVGPVSDPVLTADVLFSQRVRWIRPRPLVFINGCRTTAVEPEKVVEFASALVGNAQAAGVIGTEITIFEPLATVFGLEYLRRFIAGASVGDAVRGARLALLKRGNPLGLAYVPFALASLRMAQTTT